MAYASYEYYRDDYVGTMSDADFRRLSRQASAYLDQVTFDRIQAGWESGPNADRIRMACCAVADAYLLNEQGGGVASETNDGISVTYMAGISKAKTDDGRLYDAACMYLGRTGLMCRAID